MTTVPRVHRPCSECPWKLDTAPGQFPACNYRTLEGTSEQQPGHEPGFEAPFFACHKTPEGADRACAGWLAVEGANHLGVRLAVAQGLIPASALSPGDDWPELFASFREMADRQAAPE